MPLDTITPTRARALVDAGQAVLVDIRPADERARVSIAGALCAPVDAQPLMTQEALGDRTPIFFCRSGNRTAVHSDQLHALAPKGLTLDGGITAWEAAGGPVIRNRRAPIEIMRQVQITAGVLILSGVGLALTVRPEFLYLAAFVGAGLTFAGVTGSCAMARMLAWMPWNRNQAA